MIPFAPPGYRAPTGHCRYGESRLPFRGPRRRLEGDYILFLGGTDTYGKFIERPFPAALEELLTLPCVNMGCVNAGVDAYLKDRTVVEAARAARVVVLQVVGAHNLSNRFYTVHPRRNDRFLYASTVLQRLYPEIDFADYSFTRHLLSDLHSTDADRFAIVREELRVAWVARMRTLMSDISSPVLLFWFANHQPGAVGFDDPNRHDPLFVDQEMLEAVRPSARQFVELSAADPVAAHSNAGMVFEPSQTLAAEQLLGVAAHRQAAAVLTGPLRRMLTQIGAWPQKQRATQLDGPSSSDGADDAQSFSISSGTAEKRSATRP